MGSFTAPGSGGSYDPGAALSLQSAYQAAIEAYNNARLNQLEIPQLGFTAASDATKNMFQGGQLGLAQQQDAIRNMYSGGTLGLDQQTQQQSGLQAAANAQSTEAMNAMKLIASLSGPKDAFQQQAVLSGMNQYGLSNAVNAIAGQYALPEFQAPQAAPQAASLGGIAQELQAAGGNNGGGYGGYGGYGGAGGSQSYAGMTPTQIAMSAAMQHSGQAPSYAAPGMQASNQELNGSYWATPGMQAANQMWGGVGKYNGGAALGGNTSALTMPSQMSQGATGATGGSTSGADATGTTGATPGGGWWGQLQAYGGGLAGRGMQTPNMISGQMPGGYQQSQASMGQNGQNALAGQSGQSGQSGQPNTSASAYGAALPALNQINARNWMQMPTSTQQFMTSAYGANGYSAQDVQDAVKNNLPQFKAPTFGLIGG